MNGLVSTCGNKRREKKSGVPNALGQETSDVSFYAIKRWVNHQEKYACKALLVRKFILHPLIYTRLEFNLSPNMVVCQRDLLSKYDNELVFVKRKDYFSMR